jgi:hypothetical protein
MRLAMRTAVLIWSLIAALSIPGCTALHRTVVPGAVYEEPAAEGLADDELAVLSINPRLELELSKRKIT